MTVKTYGPYTKNSGGSQVIDLSGNGWAITQVRVRWTGVDKMVSPGSDEWWEYPAPENGSNNTGWIVDDSSGVAYDHASVTVTVPSPTKGSCTGVAIQVKVYNMQAERLYCYTDFEDNFYLDPYEERVFNYSPGCPNVGSSYTFEAWFGSANKVRVSVIATTSWTYQADPIYHPAVPPTYASTQNPRATCNSVSSQYSGTITNGATTPWAVVNSAFIDGDAKNTITFTIAGSGIAKFSVEVTYATDPPVANFSGTPLEGVIPLPVQFTDKSTNDPNQWYWSFGDDSHSEEKNPAHTYTSAGTYTVKLKAWNGAGYDIEQKTDYVTATPSRPVSIGVVKVDYGTAGTRTSLLVAALDDPLISDNSVRVCVDGGVMGCAALVAVTHPEASKVRVYTHNGKRAWRLLVDE